eukprot:696177-Alexandrium_andersonii.AAC.1
MHARADENARTRKHTNAHAPKHASAQAIEGTRAQAHKRQGGPSTQPHVRKSSQAHKCAHKRERAHWRARTKHIHMSAHARAHAHEHSHARDRALAYHAHARRFTHACKGCAHTQASAPVRLRALCEGAPACL